MFCRLKLMNCKEMEDSLVPDKRVKVFFRLQHVELEIHYNTTIIGISTTSSVMDTDTFLASIELPESLFDMDRVTNSSVGGGIGLVFLIFETPVLFPLPNGTQRDIQIRSSVIGALLGGVPSIIDLVNPIIITLHYKDKFSEFSPIHLANNRNSMIIIRMKW